MLEPRDKKNKGKGKQSGGEKNGIIIRTMNYYPRNGQKRGP